MTVPADVADVGSVPLRNPRHETFAAEYVATNNAHQAFATAFPDAKVVPSRTHRLRHQPDIAERIDWLRRQTIERLNARALGRVEQVIERLWWLSDYPDVSHLYTEDERGFLKLKPIQEWPPATRYAVRDIVTKIIPPIYNSAGEQVKPPVQILKVRMEGRKAPLELLARHYGALTGEGDGGGNTWNIYVNNRPWRAQDPMDGKVAVPAKGRRVG